MAHYVGIDFGTSGARLMVISESHEVRYEQAMVFPSLADRVDSMSWSKALFTLLASIPTPLKFEIQRIAINGTSSTVLLCDQSGTPLAPPKLYNDSCAPETLVTLKATAPADHVVLGATSSLAKLLAWQSASYFSQAHFLLHQADWLAAQLHGEFGWSDYHNSLKLGFDPQALRYPAWFDLLGLDLSLLPNPIQPGTVVGLMRPHIARQLGFSTQIQICAGTTDSIAAFLASGAEQIGDAVTSLGSTIALKLLSQTRVEASAFGVYSHWFGNRWLVGGASNAGGAILSHFFSDDELRQLSQEIDWTQPSMDHYVPLLSPGERFPIHDPTLQPCLQPRPDDPVKFLQALLASLTRIEVEGYQKLKSLGASKLKRLYTAGGGSKNGGWMHWRQRQLGVPFANAQQSEAAFGTAKLAAGILKEAV